MEPVLSVYTAGWKTGPPDWKYKHDFSGLYTVTTITDQQIKILPEIQKPTLFSSALGEVARVRF